MCKNSNHDPDCECHTSTEWSVAYRALWVTFVVALPGVAGLLLSAYYMHLVRSAVDTSNAVMISWFGTTASFFNEALFYMSFTLAVYVGTLVCLLAPFGEWIWKRNCLRSREMNILTWKRVTMWTFIAGVAIGLLWPYLTIEVGAYGPLGGFFAALIAIGIVYGVLMWRYNEVAAWTALLLAVAGIGMVFLAIQSVSAEKAPRPSIGHIMRYVNYHWNGQVF